MTECVSTISPKSLHDAEQTGIEPATSWLQVWCHKHYTTTNVTNAVMYMYIRFIGLTSQFLSAAHIQLYLINVHTFIIVVASVVVVVVVVVILFLFSIYFFLFFFFIDHWQFSSPAQNISALIIRPCDFSALEIFLLMLVDKNFTLYAAAAAADSQQSCII